MPVVPYMPFYVADYMADTSHLTTTEHGAYLLLILSYWQSKKPLRATNGRLASVARMSNEDWLLVEPALSEFFEKQGDKWVHKRIDAELLKLSIKLEQNRKAGIASGIARKQKAESKLNGRSNGRSTPAKRTYERNVNHTDADADGKEVSVKVEVLSTTEDLRNGRKNGDGLKGNSPVYKNGHSVPSASSVVNPEQVKWMKNLMHDYMRMAGTPLERKAVKPPDEFITSKACAAVNNAARDDVSSLLRDLWNNEQTPRHATGPKKYSWFVAVFAEKFGGPR